MAEFGIVVGDRVTVNHRAFDPGVIRKVIKIEEGVGGRTEYTLSAPGQANKWAYLQELTKVKDDPSAD